MRGALGGLALVLMSLTKRAQNDKTGATANPRTTFLQQRGHAAHESA